VPELPEVEQTVRELRPVLEGATINRVVVRRRRLRRLLPRDFEARLEGTTVRALGRRGKYLVAALSSGETLVMHLGMSGSFEVWTSNAPPPGKHDHVLFQLGSGATVVFNDPRRFGSMQIHSGHGDPLLGLLGPEPLDSAFDARALATSLCRRRTTLKAALCDQRVVAGLGNIYVSEALYRARLSPRRRCGTLVTPAGGPRPALRRLARAIRETLTDALAGTGEDDGRFRVYGRDGLRCRRRGCPGRIRRIVQGGRSTFFCPVCQR
jgi:formamidopyrimidine-DNA glycosylase